MEWTGTTSKSGPIRPKQTKNKKSFYWIFLKKLGIIITNKTPAKSKHSNYGLRSSNPAPLYAFYIYSGQSSIHAKI